MEAYGSGILTVNRFSLRKTVYSLPITAISRRTGKCCPAALTIRNREAKKKKDQRRNYIIGELISKYFPEVLKLEPGTKAENAITFEPLEVFLSILSNDKILMKRLKKAAKYTILNTRKNENFSDGKRSNV